MITESTNSGHYGKTVRADSERPVRDVLLGLRKLIQCACDHVLIHVSRINAIIQATRGSVPLIFQQYRYPVISLAAWIIALMRERGMKVVTRHWISFLSLEAIATGFAICSEGFYHNAGIRAFRDMPWHFITIFSSLWNRRQHSRCSIKFEITCISKYLQAYEWRKHESRCCACIWWTLSGYQEWGYTSSFQG